MNAKNTIKSSSWFLLALPALAALIAMVILLSGSRLYAGQETHGNNDDRGANTSQAHSDDVPHETGDGHDHEMDLGQERAAHIAVAEPPKWYSTVVWSIGILFVLAATLGSAAIVLKGPEPPDPAEEHGHH